MDPASAIGLASSIVQLITFSSDLLSKTREIHSSADGAAVENVELEAISTSLLELSREVNEGKFHLTKADKQLKDLCAGCQKVADELLEVVRRLKGSDSKTKWRSFRQAVLTVWKEKEVRALVDRLERYRSQIDTALLVALRQRIESAGSQFANLKGESSAILLDNTRCNPDDNFRREFIEELHKGNWQFKTEQDLESFSTYFSDSTTKHRDQLQQRRILEHLRFSNFASRYEQIEEAHKKTFEWIFKDQIEHRDPCAQSSSSSSQDDSRRSQIGFVDWLQGDGNLFWITGKPGSGKSTLVKYLYDDPRTLEHLQKWRRPGNLTRAGFFFWNSGTAMQMSRDGLFRTLLYDALQDNPSDVPRHFPDRWRYCELFGTDLRPWSTSELQKAFESLVSMDSARFFFMIDGLDEFDGNSKELAEWIIHVSRRPNVKLCVASRPWLAFEDAFKSLPYLRVETLTSHDIRIFTAEKLQESSMFIEFRNVHPSSAEELISEILEKAAGVFLWVRLVVQSLMEGLRDGCTLADLHKRLREIPPDLENLFQKILDDHKSSHYRQQACRMIRVLLGFLELRFSMKLLVMSFVDYNLDEAISAKFQSLDADSLRYQAESARRRLNSRCKGLIEVPSYSTKGSEATVEFLHRTVRDFVSRLDIQEYFRRVENNFDPLRAIGASSILYLKSVERTGERRPARRDTVMTEFLVAAKIVEKLGAEEALGRERVAVELERLFEMIYEYKHVSDEFPSALDLELLSWDTLRSGPYPDFLIWAISYKLGSCVRYTVSHRNLKYPFYGRLALRAAVKRCCVEAVETLLQLGVDPNSYNSARSSPWTAIALDFIDGGTPSRNERLREDRRKILELFDEYGARPRLHLKGCSSEEVERKLDSRKLRWYRRVDGLTKGGLTFVMGIGRSNNRVKAG